MYRVNVYIPKSYTRTQRLAIEKLIEAVCYRRWDYAHELENQTRYRIQCQSKTHADSIANELRGLVPFVQVEFATNN